MSEEAFPASAKIVEALEKFPYSGEPNESPFTLAFGSSFFERKVKQPETMQRFAQAMSGWSQGDGSEHMRDFYNWTSIPKGATVVDVGGAAGHISLAIASKLPQLQFLVEDLAPVSEQANRLISSFPESVSERVKFLAHDFFEPQPVEARNAAVYIMRYILHDWSDIYARKILKNIFDAMGRGSKLLVADAVMPPAGVLPRCQEEILRSFDMVRHIHR